MSFRLAAALGAVLFSTSAYALPLLSENAAQNQGSALTLYPDSNNPNLFYFFPNSSKFAVDTASGLPAFGFTYWGLEPAADDAGGYMTCSSGHGFDDWSQRDPQHDIG
jgi:hypothetical protein